MLIAIAAFIGKFKHYQSGFCRSVFVGPDESRNIVTILVNEAERCHMQLVIRVADRIPLLLKCVHIPYSSALVIPSDHVGDRRTFREAAQLALY